MFLAVKINYIKAEFAINLRVECLYWSGQLATAD